MRKLPFSLLVTVAFSCALICGCNSSENTEFREFSDQDRINSLETESAGTSPDAIPESTSQSPIEVEVAASSAEEGSPSPDSEPIIVPMSTAPEVAELGSSSKKPVSDDATIAKVLPANAEVMSPASTSSANPAERMAPLEPKLLIAEKTFQIEGPNQALRVSFDDIDLLKVLNMEPVPENAPEMFPDWLKNLDGKRVLIRGFMYPTLSKTGITYFQHVRDNEICCFGRTPKIYDRISTILQAGKPAEYIQGRPYDVLGTLRMDPIYEDGEWLQLYLLEDAIVLDK
ncbi:hypothetical protein [Rubinisphaera italica]|uniref:DUF3299 domain-containing protein n=1 Tax=Rubinisphaera italica TaxID=2527969 RepID=A0A5C5XG61_9PLAN|nr:hypothetical protein [Rubinisphaera italica]TWT61165.1 hypothetical protein Pan54_19000 [Rubinisphaera italica]